MRLIDADELNTHKFLTPQVKLIGGRHNGKTREQIIESYQKGWNDAIDAIIDNAPTVEDRTREVLSLQETIRKLTKERPHGEYVDISKLRLMTGIEGRKSKMNNDLISREALKKALKEAHINMELTFDIATFNCVMSTIDNAPPVRNRPILGVVTADGSIVFKEIKGERPRGAWEIVNPNEPDSYKSVVKCTICGQKYNYIDLCEIAPVKCFPNYCPNCGADMREEAADD